VSPSPPSGDAWLLDTNVVTETLKAAPDATVLHTLGARPETAGWISVLTLAEFAQGVERLSPDHPRRPAFEAQLAEVARRFAGRVLPVDAATALRYGRLAGALTRAGRRPPVIDALLAATAIEHGMTLVTRNVRDVAGTGARVLDPWREGGGP
jgi:predicted nucleic acid-binding protein